MTRDQLIAQLREQLIPRFVAKSIPGRLATAERKLAQFELHPDFDALPNSKRARIALKVAGEFCKLKQWDRADAQLEAFDADMNAAHHQLVSASERNRSVAAGKKSGVSRNRNVEIIAHHQKIMEANGGDSPKATASCAKKYRMSLGHVRRIIATKK